MDPVTHGLAGASLAAAAGGGSRTVAAVAGALGAMVVDADVLLRSPTDPLLQLELHRHFSHALIFVPVAAALVAGAVWLVRRRWPRGVDVPLGFGRLWWYAVLGCATAGLLDACTSYGTHLLWPFSDARTAWSIIAVVDPLFSLVLLLGLVMALLRNSGRAAAFGLAAAGCYLALGVVQHGRADAALRALAAERGHSIERRQVKPTLANLLLWRGLYEADGRFWVAAVRVGVAPAVRLYPGGSALRVDVGGLALPVGSTQARDAQRFEALSAGYLVQHPDQPAVLGDLRYAMRPDGLVPLWGVALDPTRPDAHVALREFRNMDAATWQRFTAMLAGRPLPPPPAAGMDTTR